MFAAGDSHSPLAQLGAALRGNPRALACMVKNFYRDANARADAETDAAQIDALGLVLMAEEYVWRELVFEFVASDAFRSAPATSAAEGG